MRPASRKKAVTVFVIVVLFLGCWVWVLWPQPPSSYRTAVAEGAYLHATLRTAHLTEPPVSHVLSGLGYAFPHVPRGFRFLLPPTVSLLLHSEQVTKDQGWTILTDLGWRARLVCAFSGFLRARLPGDVVLLQDQGTLFVTPNRLLLQDVELHRSSRGARSRSSPVTDEPETPPRVLLTVALSNKNREVTHWVERLQTASQFLIFPSVGEMESLRLILRRTDGHAVKGEVAILVRDGGEVEAVRADLDYLVDLLDRVMRRGEVGLEKTTQVNARHILMEVTVLHPDDLAQVPWAELRKGL